MHTERVDTSERRFEFFLLSGFSFDSIHDSQVSRERGKLSL